MAPPTQIYSLAKIAIIITQIRTSSIITASITSALTLVLIIIHIQIKVSSAIE
jgi:hypothetical protein